MKPKWEFFFFFFGFVLSIKCFNFLMFPHIFSGIKQWISFILREPEKLLWKSMLWVEMGLIKWSSWFSWVPSIEFLSYIKFFFAKGQKEHRGFGHFSWVVYIYWKFFLRQKMGIRGLIHLSLVVFVFVDLQDAEEVPGTSSGCLCVFQWQQQWTVRTTQGPRTST